MSKCKRILALVLTLVTMVSVMSVTAFAANTKDTGFTDFELKTSEWYYCITPRDKTNTTPVYLYYTKGIYNAVRVRAFGQTSYSGSRIDCTWYNGKYVSYVTCTKDTKYSIRSKIYEDGYRWASLGFWSQYPDKITGVWSPDSTRTYTVAKP